jgi:NAD(P)H-hydrate epimerase
MQTITVKKMQELEMMAEEKYGISALILMENAGRSIADAVDQIYGKRYRKIILLCGKGNNGGDGFVAARHLHNRGYWVSVVLFGDPDRLTADATVNFTIVKKMKIPLKIISVNRGQRIRQLEWKVGPSLRRAELVIDALFGTGLREDLEEPFLSLIQFVNDSHKKIVSIDVPSGLDADTGEIRGAAIKADCTVTLGFAKQGLRRNFGREHCGGIVVGDISLPREAK